MDDPKRHYVRRPEAIPAKALILLALAKGPQHGYALFDAIIGDTIGYYVRKSTLYRSLDELERDGMATSAEGHGSTRAYKLTPEGRDALRSLGRLWGRTAELVVERLR
jgi:DNA-binding PadR family transcriptional regulator